MDPGERKPKIIITLDLVHTLLRRHEMRETPQAVKRLQRLEQEAARRVKIALKGHDVHLLDSQTLEEGFRTHLAGERLPIISIDDIHVPTALHNPNLYHLHLTRQYNADTDTHGHGPRTHAPPLDDQLEFLSERLNGKLVALVDTGIFGGETLRRSISRLESKGIHVKKIYAGVVRRKGLSRIRELLPEIEVVPVLGESGMCDDWMFEMRDLIFGGRVVRTGSRTAGTIHYCDAPEFFLPNPRIKSENRERAMMDINAGELVRIGKELRAKFNQLRSVTRMVIQKNRKPVQVFGRRVAVHRLMNYHKGKTW